MSKEKKNRENRLILVAFKRTYDIIRIKKEVE